MHTFILAVILFVYGLAEFVLGIYFANEVRAKIAVAKSLEQAEAVKVISVIDRLKAFWAKVRKVF